MSYGVSSYLLSKREFNGRNDLAFGKHFDSLRSFFFFF